MEEPRESPVLQAELKAEITKVGGQEDVEPVGATEETTAVGNGLESTKDQEMELDPQSEEELGTSGERGGEVEEKGGMRAEEMKHWTAVKENPSDFNNWTALLQFVERKDEVLPARKAYDAFLQLYPYCYGYWKKYADLENKHSNTDTAKEVFERGVTAIPLSVDLWVHYASFTQTQLKTTKEIVAEGTETTKADMDTAAKNEMRSFYARAVEACGMEYRSGKIWDSYLQWEEANRTPRDVLAVYDQLLPIPTQQYRQYFEKCKQLIESTPSSELLTQQEYDELSDAVDKEVTASGQTSQTGEDEGGKEEEEKKEKMDENAKESKIREKVLERRTAVHEMGKSEVEKRVQFEDGIKRPYFHVKPLERTQLKNWMDYLDFEVSQGDQRRIIVLFERCLIACALYEDFWLKFARYTEDTYPEYASYVYSRVCNIHLLQKPNVHLAWATFEEERGNVDTAREILRNIDSVVPGVVLTRLRRIGVEMREKKYDRAEALYLESVAGAQSSEARNFYAGKYAGFAARVLGDRDKAAGILKEAIDQDKLNPTLYLRLLDVELSRHPLNHAAVEAVFKLVHTNELSEDVQEKFALRRAQFLEETGASLTTLLEAQAAYEKLKKVAVGRKRASVDTESEPSKKARLGSTSQDASVVGPGTTPVSMEQPTDVQAQQWAAYQQQQQQQWGAYNYGQGYNYQQYYQYPYQQQPTQ